MFERADAIAAAGIVYDGVNRPPPNPTATTKWVGRHASAGEVAISYFGPVLEEDGRLWLYTDNSRNKKRRSLVDVQSLFQKIDNLSCILAEDKRSDGSRLFAISRFRSLIIESHRKPGKIHGQRTLSNIYLDYAPHVPYLTVNNVIDIWRADNGNRTCDSALVDFLDANCALGQVSAGSVLSVLGYNLLSENVGSREDGINQLQFYRARPSSSDEADLLNSYFASCDASANVRCAAERVLKAPTEGKVRILFPKSAKLPKGFLADFRNIPAGSFLMGSDLSSDSNSLPEERPQHRVYLDSFKIGCTPVTVGDWSSYMRDTFTRRPEDKGLQIYLPITNVSWYDAIEYCTWITSAARLAGHIRVDEEITLPSEAQWEKAARGTDGRIFPWGDIFEPTYVNYRDSGTAHPVDVGIHPVEGNSPYGVADMAGNVWEWTRSLWGRSGASPEYGYPYCPEDGREDLSAPGDVRRIIRGGSWYYFDYCLRCSTRNLMYPYVGHSGGGFRLVIQKTKPIL